MVSTGFTTVNLQTALLKINLIMDVTKSIKVKSVLVVAMISLDIALKIQIIQDIS